MIQKIYGNLFESKCDIIVNPTNSIGVMGAGLAFVFKTKYPDICRTYDDFSTSYQQNFKALKLMMPVLYKAGTLNNDRSVLMFATKIHWKNDSKYEYLKQNLEATLNLLVNENYPSIAFPLIGAGHGGLKPELVIEMIEKTFADYTGMVEIYTT